MYCQCIIGPKNYTPNSNEQGNPQDCQQWSTNLTFANDARSCVYLIDNISTTDYVLLCISGFIWIIVIILMIFKCKYKDYPAVHLETYQKIVHINGLGLFNL